MVVMKSWFPNKIFHWHSQINKEALCKISLDGNCFECQNATFKNIAMLILQSENEKEQACAVLTMVVYFKVEGKVMVAIQCYIQHEFV